MSVVGIAVKQIGFEGLLRRWCWLHGVGAGAGVGVGATGVVGAGAVPPHAVRARANAIARMIVQTLVLPKGSRMRRNTCNPRRFET